MGLAKLWMKRGPGNIGSLAKAQAKVYNQFKRQYPQLSQDELLRRTLRHRLAAGAMLGDAALSEAEEDTMIREARGSLAKLTLEVAHHENPDLLHLVNNSPDTYREMVDVVIEVTAEHTD